MENTYLHSNINHLGDNLGIGVGALLEPLPALVERRGGQGPSSAQRNAGRILVTPLGQLGVRLLGEGVNAVQAEHDVSLRSAGEFVDADGELVGEAAFPVLGQDDLEAAVTDLQGGLASKGVDAWEEGEIEEEGNRLREERI